MVIVLLSTSLNSTRESFACGPPLVTSNENGLSEYPGIHQRSFNPFDFFLKPRVFSTYSRFSSRIIWVAVLLISMTGTRGGIPLVVEECTFVSRFDWWIQNSHDTFSIDAHDVFFNLAFTLGDSKSPNLSQNMLEAKRMNCKLSVLCRSLSM